ncbi:unnamed protein product [Dovyalis caffra]|uniref:Uncharacterized protein n=1 Tax=Dovyalis caffra TaxID=77055 RepID=A0AAV1RIL6_9ROSI|nr:unnamed protein product [Dovyalis caffra]
MKFRTEKKKDGELSEDRGRDNHKEGFRCGIPVPENDPMYVVPKEVDYYRSSGLPYPSYAFQTYTD